MGDMCTKFEVDSSDMQEVTQWSWICLQANGQKNKDVCPSSLMSQLSMIVKHTEMSSCPCNVRYVDGLVMHYGISNTTVLVIP